MDSKDKAHANGVGVISFYSAWSHIKTCELSLPKNKVCSLSWLNLMCSSIMLSPRVCGAHHSGLSSKGFRKITASAIFHFVSLYFFKFRILFNSVEHTLTSIHIQQSILGITWSLKLITVIQLSVGFLKRSLYTSSAFLGADLFIAVAISDLILPVPV